MRSNRLYLGFMSGVMVGFGSVEINHHWLNEIGAGHSGWVGLAMMLAGIAIYLAATLEPGPVKR